MLFYFKIKFRFVLSSKEDKGVNVVLYTAKIAEIIIGQGEANLIIMQQKVHSKFTPPINKIIRMLIMGVRLY